METKKVLFGFLFLISLIFDVTQSHIGGVCSIGYTLQGVCQSVYDCAPVTNALRSGQVRPEVMDYMRRLKCGFSGLTPLVCCSPRLNFEPLLSFVASPRTYPPVTRPRPNPPVPSPRPNPPVTSLRSRRPVIAPVDLPVDQGVLPDTEECGWSVEERIFGGNVTDITEFPWMAILGYTNDSGSISFECGGVLINSRYVLTAAHCIHTRLKLELVRLGEYNLATNPDCVGPSEYGDCAPPHIDLRIEETIVHPGFSMSNANRKDDIALLRLEREVPFSDFVSPICLPRPESRLRNNETLLVAGWGKTLSGAKSDVKLKLRVPLFDKLKCDRLFKIARADLSHRQVCAGGEFAKDSCSGDSGGPLMKTTRHGRWETIGIISFGAGCGRDGWPGVYTHVQSYLSWIRQNVRK